MTIFQNGGHFEIVTDHVGFSNRFLVIRLHSPPSSLFIKKHCYFRWFHFFLRSFINRQNIEAELSVKRTSVFAPSWISISIKILDSSFFINQTESTFVGLDLKITHLPPKPELLLDSNYCNNANLGNVFDPTNKEQLTNEKTIGK